MSLVFSDPWKDIVALNVIWCLTDVTKENGATLHIPGSNYWTTRELLVPFEGKAGDIIVMDGRVWHTSGSNVTEDQDRALLFGYYTAESLRQQVNWTAKLSREVQDTLTSEQKNWLGLGVAGNIGVTGDFRYLSVQFPDTKVA